MSDKFDKRRPFVGKAVRQAQERRRADRRRSASDRRIWRALATERRVAERRRALDRRPAQPEKLGRATSSLQTTTEAAPEIDKAIQLPHIDLDATDDTKSAPQAARADEPLERHSTRTPEDQVSDEARLARLRSMLDAAALRQARNDAKRLRRPVMAAGVTVRVTAGTRARAVGTIIDADYINARALVRFDGEPNGIWIGFRDLSSAESLKAARR